MIPVKRGFLYSCIAILFLILLFQLDLLRLPRARSPEAIYRLKPQGQAGKFDWGLRKEDYPVDDYRPIPAPYSKGLPKVQHESIAESPSRASERRGRQEQVKAALQRCWASYREHAWLHDELAPLSGGARDPFGGWAATLVDTLDTLWIMDLKAEFWEAVEAALTIDFTKTSQDTINVFETTIRYLVYDGTV